MANRQLNVFDQISRLNYRFKRAVRGVAKGSPPPVFSTESNQSIPTIAEIKAF